jgi:hypothetical protein
MKKFIKGAKELLLRPIEFEHNPICSGCVVFVPCFGWSLAVCAANTDSSLC